MIFVFAKDEHRASPCHFGRSPIEVDTTHRMRRSFSVLVCALTALASASAQQFELSLDSRAAAEALTLPPDNFSDSPYRLTAIERALRIIEKQIDEKHAADAPKSAIQQFWDAEFWHSPLMKFIPVGGGPERYPEDPFVLANYLTVDRRQSDYQLKLSDEHTREFFSK